MLIKVKKDREHVNQSAHPPHLSLLKEFPAAITTTLSLRSPINNHGDGAGGGRLN
jgi:hypothetical protein